MSEHEEVPSQGWKDLVEGITLLSKGGRGGNYPTNCGHDTIYLNSDPSVFTEEELSRLHELGFFPDTEFGGGFMSYRFGSC